MERNKAIETVKSCINPYQSDALRDALETLIPELRESEDDGIRKDLIEFVRQYGDNFYGQFSKASAISWLEKQGERSVNKMQVSDELYEHIRNTCACIDDALSSKTLADINEYLSMAEHSAQSAFYMIEKQGEQKTNKFKPKFKVGDWIACNGFHPVLILDIVDDKYEIESTYDGSKGFHSTTIIDKFFRLWTIDDATDGDVLVLKRDKSPFIFKGICKFYPECPEAYCGIDEIGTLMVSGCGRWTDEEVEPATKEERNFLFNRIKESGYKWDAEKKELIGENE